MRKFGILSLALLLALWGAIALAQGGPHGIQLAWQPGVVDATHEAAASFNVYRGTTAGGPYTKIASTLAATTTYLDSSGTAGTAYFYVATAVGADSIESDFSNEATAVFPKVPAAVTGLTARPK